MVEQRFSTRRRVGVRIAVVGGVAVAALSATGPAWASWSGSGIGTGTAATATFDPPTAVTASTAPGSGTVSLSWSAATLSTGQQAQGYYVVRIDTADNSAAGACGTTPGSTVTGLACSDTSIADGTYRYVVTGVDHSWTAASAASDAVTVTNRRPAVTLEQASGQSDPTNAAPVRFSAVFDEPVSGFAASDVTLSGSAGGVATVSGSGTTYTISVSGMSGTGTVSASIPGGAAQDANGAGNTASTSTDNSVLYDVTVPGAPAPGVSAAITSGSKPTFVNNEAVTFTDSASDAHSGVASVAYYRCVGASGSCASGNGTLIGSSATAPAAYSVTSTAPLAADGVYRVVAVVTDRAGNVTTSDATLVAVDTTAPTVSAPIVNGHS